MMQYMPLILAKAIFSHLTILCNINNSNSTTNSTTNSATNSIRNSINSNSAFHLGECQLKTVLAYSDEGKPCNGCPIQLSVLSHVACTQTRSKQ
jgi:hypothetical protein